MGASFLITLREGLEASLIIAILLTYLQKTNRWADARYVWNGAAVAVGVCLVSGIAIFLALDGMEGKLEYAVEGFIALFAMAVLTHMIFWMRAHARSLGQELRDKVDRSAASALAIIAFAAVAREGLETVLFLLSAKTESASGSQVVVGGLLGLVVAVILGVVVYRGGNRVNLKTFFNVTAVLLLMFAAGLAGKAVHELRELIAWEDGWLVQPMWTIESGMWSSGTFYDFMRGLFGWHRSPENIRVIAYFVYLLPVLAIYLRDAKPKSSNTVVQNRTESAQVV
jgi:high-affinity iron transporter